MSVLDWLIVVIPVLFVMYMGMYSRRYIRGVADFLAAGRICGRYAISVADVANGLSIITLVAYVEVQYKTGFAVGFWSNIIMPLSIVLSLTGYCTYRFRETKAMSLGQFLEMRYNRSFRIFAAALRSISEMLANMICPAVAARFFIYFLDLPQKFQFCGMQIDTFVIIVIIVLFLAISIICMGGTLALVITDTIQGLFCYPMLVVFSIFVLVKFSWFNEIVPTMIDRAAGESFLNPYDVDNLRDFNLFALVVSVVVTLLHRASWIGAGNTSAAKSPHEQKMAAVLGTWRTGFSGILYLLIAVMIITLLNHKDFARDAKEVRDSIAARITEELVTDPAQREKMMADITAIPPQIHEIGVDVPLSQDKNLDTTYFDVAYKNLQDFAASTQGTEQEIKDAKAKANHNFQQFRTLFNQLMFAMSMRKLLPMGLMGLFCLLMILMMVSTDDSRIYSAALTISQDVVMPLRKKSFTPEGHIRMIRIVSIGVGVFFLIGSSFMSQLDYINLYSQIMCSMWMGGCGPVMIFGLYSRFGTTAGAFASLITGMVLSLGGIMVQRNWANVVYPFLSDHGWATGFGNFLEAVSKPFNPYVVWKMNAIKFPVNSTEIYFLTMMICMVVYIVVSFATKKEPFNLERMLHRGIYNLDGDNKDQEKTTLRNLFSKLIGITPEYTKGDKIIAWSVFLYSFVYKFCGMFILVVILNHFFPWKIEAWGYYFFFNSLLIPGIVAFISTIWFTIGGAIDLRQLFKDLKQRTNNPLDNGAVDGTDSIVDKAQLDAAENKDASK